MHKYWFASYIYTVIYRDITKNNNNNNEARKEVVEIAKLFVASIVS